MEKCLHDSKRFKEKEIKEELYASFGLVGKKNIAIDDHALKMEAKRLAEL